VSPVSPPGVVILLCVLLALPLHAIVALVLGLSLAVGPELGLAVLARGLGAVCLLLGLLTVLAGIDPRMNVLVQAVALAVPTLALGALALQIDVLIGPRGPNREEVVRMARLGPCVVVVVSAYALLALGVAGPRLADELGGAGRLVTTLDSVALLALAAYRLRGDPPTAPFPPGMRSCDGGRPRA
jgi:hypothetical protein